LKNFGTGWKEIPLPGSIGRSLWNFTICTKKMRTGRRLAVPVLRSLHEIRISIIDWGALPRVFETDGPAQRRPPSRAIENIGSDYAEDEEKEEDEDEDADLGELGDEFPC